MENQEEEILGYNRKRVNRENKYGEPVHFTLTGKKGGAYQLCEIIKSVYFVRNRKGDIVALKGNYTFSTSREYLRVIGSGCCIPEKEAGK